MPVTNTFDNEIDVLASKDKDLVAKLAKFGADLPELSDADADDSGSVSDMDMSEELANLLGAGAAKQKKARAVTQKKAAQPSKPAQPAKVPRTANAQHTTTSALLDELQEQSQPQPQQPPPTMLPNNVNLSMLLEYPIPSLEATNIISSLAPLPDMLAHGRTRRGRRRRGLPRVFTDREYIGEIAARAPVVDTINLVDAVMPSVTGSYSLLSDDEAEAEQASTSKPSKEITKVSTHFDVDNPELTIKIKWSGLSAYKRYKLRKHQKFEHLMTQLAADENISVEEVTLNLNEHIIKPADTPDSIGYRIVHVIEGRAMRLNVTASPALLRKSKKFQLKIQIKDRKRPLFVDIKKTEPLKLLYIKCSEELQIPYSEFKLTFDGETLSYTETAADQELEGGEAIDLIMKKT